MSHRHFSEHYGTGIYRDRENGWIFGVCAGIAERFEFNTLTVRLLAVFALVLMFWPTVIVYLLLVALLRRKPLTYAGARHERDFWQSCRCDNWRNS